MTSRGNVNVVPVAEGDNGNNNNNDAAAIPMVAATLCSPLPAGAATPEGPIGTGVAMLVGAGQIELPPVEEEKKINPSQLAKLQAEGFPHGLAEELAKLKSKFPVRYWLVDNSGSMWENDGRALRVLKGHSRIVQCTRWKELQGTVEYHAQAAATIEASTTFRLLNDPGRHNGPQEFSIARYTKKPSTTIMRDLQIAEETMRKSQPQGATPLTQHVVEIMHHIRSVADELDARGQKAVVVIATDGLPSDDGENSTYATQQAFIQALNELRGLPVWLVVRLCTKDKDIVDFYNDLDHKLEIELEVLVDFFRESEEVCEHNPWLNYGLPIHRCREMGYHHRIFDLLDERPLNRDEVKQFVETLFGTERMQNAPDIHSEFKNYIKFITKICKEEGKVFNALTEKVEPWINVGLLEKSFKTKSARSFFSRGKKKNHAVGRD